jgi:hypothetical protein
MWRSCITGDAGPTTSGETDELQTPPKLSPWQAEGISLITKLRIGQSKFMRQLPSTREVLC